MSRKGPSKRRGGRADAQPPPEHDAWAPPLDEIGLTLSQALRGSRLRFSQSRARAAPDPGPAEESPAPVQSPSKRPKVDDAADPPGSGAGAEGDLAAEPTEQAEQQQQAIVAMFTDSEGDAGDRKSAGSTRLEDGGDASDEHAAQFMDEESAANYQRILAQRDQARQRAATREAGRRKRAQPPPDREARSSTEDLPMDPLAVPGRAHRQIQASDSEPDALDQSVVLQQRLRTRPRVSAARQRIEQARRDMQQQQQQQPPSDSSSDFESAPARGRTRTPKGAGRRAAAPSDGPETDSESERRQPRTVLVIRDSSDDDSSFVSEPADLPARPDRGAAPASSAATMDRFLSAFEPLRQRQMGRQSLRMGSGARRSQAGTDAPAPHEEASSHSQEPDDDLADFIIDDDDDDDNNNGAGSPAGADSEGSAGPTLSRARTQGPASLMPEEFSQLDVPTSFKTYVQYLIYWICNGRRALVVSDEIARYFYLGYITVARVVDSVEQSLVASSAWVDDFRTDMYRFPEFAATPIHGVPGCEACHFRQKRTATFRVTLSGEPYSRRMLAPPRPGEAPAAADSGSSSSDADSVVSVADSGGPAMYNVGRTCKARSELCHELHHYCYRLAAQIDIALQPSSPGSADPDDLVTALEEQGTTDQLFSEFKDMLSRSKSGFAA